MWECKATSDIVKIHGAEVIVCWARSPAPPCLLDKVEGSIEQRWFFISRALLTSGLKFSVRWQAKVVAWYHLCRLMGRAALVLSQAP